MNRKIFKKSPEELAQYLQFRRKGARVSPKRGKGSYKRRGRHKPIPLSEDIS